MKNMVDVVLALAAVTVAGIVAKREFIDAPAPAASKLATEGGYESKLAQFAPVFRTQGNPSAKMHIHVFDDMECPFCARFHAELTDFRARDSADVAVHFVHFPLPSHRFAKPAATFAECTVPQGRFFDAIDLLFKKQDSLGLKSWSSFQNDLKLQDTLAFQACVAANDHARIDSSVALGRKMGISATPTVFLNGVRYTVPPDASELRRILDSLRKSQ